MSTQDSPTVPIDDDCPINLRYLDPSSASLNMTSILRHGHRLRRRRRYVGAAGVLASAALLAGAGIGIASIRSGTTTYSATGITDGTMTTYPATGLERTGVLRTYSPVAAVSVLGTYAAATPPGWSAVAWVSRNGYLCYGGADVVGKPTEPVVRCGTAPTEVVGPGPIALSSKPIFTTMPHQLGETLAIGFVRGGASRVRVTASGVTTTTDVTPVATGTTQSVGAYAVWIPDGPNGAVSWSNVTSVEALGPHGELLAQLS